MIKLYWNTTSHDPISGFQWGKYHANNSNTWINLVLEKINKQNVQSLDQIKKDDILIIVDCDVDKKIEFYKKLRILCSKLYLINLGDESGQKNVIKNQVNQEKIISEKDQSKLSLQKKEIKVIYMIV